LEGDLVGVGRSFIPSNKKFQKKFFWFVKNKFKMYLLFHYYPGIKVFGTKIYTRSLVVGKPFENH
jgi:hypothetical protein